MTGSITDEDTAKARVFQIRLYQIWLHSEAVERIGYADWLEEDEAVRAVAQAFVDAQAAERDRIRGLVTKRMDAAAKAAFELPADTGDAQEEAGIACVLRDVLAAIDGEDGS